MTVGKVRVVAAMSGGVDSCVAAALLQRQGYEVIGVTMQLWNHARAAAKKSAAGVAGEPAEEKFDSCCSLADVHDARVSAHRLGIPHYVVNYENEFKRGVVDQFAAEYAAGRTPNPCVLCNSKLKFDHLVERAHALGAEWVATGHYARTVHHADGRPSELYVGVDATKDQSYFLFDVRPDYLRRALFPLGGMTKMQVREIAREMGLHTADKRESQEICFVGARRYDEFLAEHYPESVKDRGGEIVDRSGRVLGQHDGYHKFTVGQRKGLGAIGDGLPLYVAGIDAKSRRVVVDALENLKVAAFELATANWLIPKEELAGRDLAVMVRYRARTVACRVEPVESESEALASGRPQRWRVLLAEPARWVTPGQAAVLYEGERVIGGGFIAQSWQADGTSPNVAPRSVQPAVAASSGSFGAV